MSKTDEREAAIVAFPKTRQNQGFKPETRNPENDRYLDYAEHLKDGEIVPLVKKP